MSKRHPVVGDAKIEEGGPTTGISLGTPFNSDTYVKPEFGSIASAIQIDDSTIKTNFDSNFAAISSCNEYSHYFSTAPATATIDVPVLAKADSSSMADSTSVT